MKFINKIKSLFWEAEKEEKTVVKKETPSALTAPMTIAKPEKKKGPKKIKGVYHLENKKKKRKQQKLSRRGNR